MDSLFLRLIPLVCFPIAEISSFEVERQFLGVLISQEQLSWKVVTDPLYVPSSQIRSHAYFWVHIWQAGWFVLRPWGLFQSWVHSHFLESAQVLSRLLSELFQEGQVGWVLGGPVVGGGIRKGVGGKEVCDGEDACLIPQASSSISLPPSAPLFYTQGSYPHPLLPLRSFLLFILPQFSSVQFSCSVASHSLWPHGLQHTRLPCPSPNPGDCSNSCPLSQWCYPTISTYPVFLRPVPSYRFFW